MPTHRSRIKNSRQGGTKRLVKTKTSEQNVLAAQGGVSDASPAAPMKSVPEKAAATPADKTVVTPAEGTSEEETLDLDAIAARRIEKEASGVRVVRKRRRRKHSKGHKRKIRRRIVAAVVVVVVVALACAVPQLILRAGRQSVSSDTSTQDTNIRTYEDAASDDDGLTVVYDGVTYRYKEDVVSVAVVGYDLDSDTGAGNVGQADALLVAAVDTSTGQVELVSIPRDAMVDVSTYVGEAFLGQDEMQACLAFSYGTDASTGALYTAELLSQLLYGMPMDYYMALSMDGVGALANAVGGVSLTPISTIPGTAIQEGLPTVLYGQNALSYVRWRDTADLSGSENRQQRQAQFARSLFSQAVSLSGGAAARLLEIYNAAADYAVTDLGATELAYLAGCVASGEGGLEVYSLAVESADVYNGSAVYYLDQQSVYETVLAVWYEPVEEDAVAQGDEGEDAGEDAQ